MYFLNLKYIVQLFIRWLPIKGNPADVKKNYRGISPMEVCYKVFTSTLSDGINAHAKNFYNLNHNRKRI